MSKNIVRGYITLAILLVVFSVIAFVAPFEKTAVFWFAYIFGVIALAYQLYVFKIAFSGEGIKSKFYGFPIARIGFIYLVVQLIVSLIEMILSDVMPVWLMIIINVIIMAFALVGCIATDAMKKEIERQDVKLKKDVSNMRALQSLSVALVGQCNENVKKQVQDLADEFRYSDPVTSDATAEFENELSEVMNELQKSIIDNDDEAVKSLCVRGTGLLAERNRICKLEK